MFTHFSFFHIFLVFYSLFNSCLHVFDIVFAHVFMFLQLSCLDCFTIVYAVFQSIQSFLPFFLQTFTACVAFLCIDPRLWFAGSTPTWGCGHTRKWLSAVAGRLRGAGGGGGDSLRTRRPGCQQRHCRGLFFFLLVFLKLDRTAVRNRNHKSAVRQSTALTVNCQGL